MRLPGWCERCRRVRTVTVSTGAYSLSLLRSGAAIGVCDECDEAQRPALRRPTSIRKAGRNGHA